MDINDQLSSAVIIRRFLRRDKAASNERRQLFEIAQPLPEAAGDQYFLALEIRRQLVKQRSAVAEGIADEHNIKLMLRPGPARIEHLRIHAERKVMNRARTE
ncbi:hypothetical protein D3C79_816640 [compost metagenome]